MKNFGILNPKKKDVPVNRLKYRYAGKCGVWDWTFVNTDAISAIIFYRHLRDEEDDFSFADIYLCNGDVKRANQPHSMEALKIMVKEDERFMLMEESQEAPDGFSENYHYKKYLNPLCTAYGEAIMWFRVQGFSVVFSPFMGGETQLPIDKFAELTGLDAEAMKSVNDPKYIGNKPINFIIHK